ncbi:Aldehyde dehydrogenase domain [Trinorchestia longiramus]|nr:Aldehyde dehydrogenase domain [Trinorchestia longiramus]
MSFKQMVQDVREVFNSGRTLDVEFRKKQLKSLRRMYIEHKDDFCAALKEDLHKSHHEGMLLEMNMLIGDIDHILHRIDDWAKPEKVKRTMLTIMDQPVIYNDPYGVVLVIGAWNYPVQLTLLPVSGAIAAGNCVIVKPSEHSPACSKIIADLLPKYIDKECFQVVLGDVPETTELLKEPFDYIFFTGSTHVGKVIQRAAAEHLTPVTLELGGKSPVYLDNTVDFDVAVRRIMWGKLVNCGQTCIAPDYLLCSKEVQGKFISKAKEVIKEFYGEDPKQSPDYCRIVAQRHVDRISQYLNEGTIATGGVVDREQKYISPTILVDLPPNSKVLSEEIFGPVLPIVNAESAYDAINYIKSRPGLPLALYVFTMDDALGALFLREVRAGGSSVNDSIFHVAVPELPFGGVGSSGMGSYHGHFSFKTFTHRKSCLHRNYNPIAEWIGRNRYPPYTDKKTAFLTKVTQEIHLPSMRYLPHLLCFALGATTAYLATYFSQTGSDSTGSA